MILHLKQARQQAGKTLEEVSFDLKIRKQYLIALEENDFSSLPGEVYAKGYLKLYSNYLGIFPKAIVQSDKTNINNIQNNKFIKESLEEKIISRKYRRHIIIISILMLLLISIIYHLISDS